MYSPLYYTTNHQQHIPPTCSSNYDNQKCSQILPNICCWEVGGQNCPLLRTIDTNRRQINTKLLGEGDTKIIFRSGTEFFHVENMPCFPTVLQNKSVVAMEVSQLASDKTLSSRRAGFSKILLIQMLEYKLYKIIYSHSIRFPPNTQDF